MPKRREHHSRLLGDLGEGDICEQRELLRELDLGPLAPEAKIIPPDQAANADGKCMLASDTCGEHR